MHFSVIEMDGYRELAAGDTVEFDYEPATRDSFDFGATGFAASATTKDLRRHRARHLRRDRTSAHLREGMRYEE